MTGNKRSKTVYCLEEHRKGHDPDAPFKTNKFAITVAKGDSRVPDHMLEGAAKAVQDYLNMNFFRV